MSSAGVMINDGQFAQDSPCPAPSGQRLFEFSKFGISFASFFARMTVVRLLDVLTNLDTFFADGYVFRAVVNPAAGVIVVDSILVAVQGGMGVSAENARGLMMARMSQGSGCNFGGEAQPARVQAI